MTPTNELLNLIAVCERMQAATGFDKEGQCHPVSKSNWQMFSAQLKQAKRFVTTTAGFEMMHYS